jgi:glycerol-3-phosphate O-acyltransferase
MVIGFALYRMRLPPFIYGAGLNLFTNPLLGFFMHNLGAYTVDRKKSDPLYKDVLKEYATLTLEYGYDNLFFPGGTRSRSGAVERKLKLGLLGTGVQAYINNLRRGAASPKIYIVPATLSFQLCLEAETLIDDFLKEVGKSRYIIDDDEFSQPKTVFDFMAKLFSLDSKIHVTVCRGYDPFGNPVDDAGESLDPCGRTVDTSRYVLRDGEPKSLADRDAEYTREVGLRIVEEFLRHNVVESTHVTAFALFGLLRDRNPKLDLLRIVRTGGADSDLPMSLLYAETDRVLHQVRELAGQGKIRIGPSAGSIAEDVVADALAHFASFHSRPAALRRGDRVIAADRTLLFYYQNRLEGYGIEAKFGRKPALTSDHRSLGQ